MGAIAEGIMAYAKPLIDTTDGSIEQLNKALAISQACWNLAIMPAEGRRSFLDELQSSVKMSDAEFADFERGVVQPMIRRHEEMFPKLHQPSSLSSPHWQEDFQPHSSAGSFRKKRRSPLALQPQPLPGLEEALRILEETRFEFPEAALRACQANREAAIPRLIEILERTVRIGQDGATPLGNATIYAIFLLAEFKIAEAIPVLWSCLKLPYNIPEDLLGDAITEDLPRILAIFAGPRLDLLDELASAPAHNQWVRSAAIYACGYLVRDGLLSRRDAILRLKSQLSEAIRCRDEAIVEPLISTLLDLNANEARAEIEAAFRENLVDEMMVTLGCVNDELRPEAPDECNRGPHHSQTEISDTVEELRGWNWQTETWEEEEDEFGDDFDDLLLTDYARKASTWLDAEPRYAPPATIRNDASRVGRNDPCPCGSGKKYKKCCLHS
jgi:hypothetical protein